MFHYTRELLTTIFFRLLDIKYDFFNLQNSQYWQLTNYSTTGARSKSSCSPDLGIESDAAVTTVRPLKDTLKITESMTNLLSDEENGNGNRRTRDTNSQSPLPIEGAFKKILLLFSLKK